MGWSVLIGPTLFVVASLVVGTRCLRLAARTHGLPEAAIGVTLLSAGAVGFGLLGGLPILPGLPPGVVTLSNAAGDVGVSLGAATLCLFVWRTYRPDRIWAATLFGVACGVLAVTTGAMLWTWSYPLPYAERPWWYFVELGFQGLAFAWASAEAFRYHAMLRRRMRIGLGDPEMTDRILMWGIAAASAFLVTTLYVALWTQRDGLVPTLGETAVLALPGIVAAATVWLAFFPPKPYREWVLARAALTR